MEVLGVCGSPRRGGNSSLLLEEALRGAQRAGAAVENLLLSEKTMSPCLEIYGCKRDGECVIKDDFQEVAGRITRADALILASPVFFYSVSAHTKILIDRCQSLWVKRHLLHLPISPGRPRRKGAFISVGATRGKRLFEGVLLTVRYFFDAIDVELVDTLLVRGVDEKGEILGYPEKMRAAYDLGKKLAELNP
ncbi:MAG: flavodoxin family protein [Deltaproteobacteria bacterium]|nr:flavodoxin family protein [Deltaproteobacteria bacterium]